ncbi:MULTISPECIES: YihY/virulence factor BrkB family protein [Blautia]|uniref:YihY/virulence factor BrkB family protein n=1 Tax=Blautia argi TaxID=1912897 RepID=A0A2Z4UAP8_9FIRM|nr:MULTISPECIES: YihY/virulence factor BrkB family protein [Blautia]AWY98125.1 YihY/virulence factor BrkB family protein [Blautia argi]
MKGFRKVVETIKGFINSMNKNHTTAYAAQAAYFLILSFIPFMLLLMTSVKYTPLTRDEVIQAVMQVCPENFDSFIRGIVNEVYEKSLGVVPVSAVIAMWSAGKGIQALTNGFNCIYQVEETRNYLMTRIRSVFYTLAFMLAIVLTLTLQVFGNSLQRELSRHLPFLDRLVSMIIGMRVVITLLTLCMVFLLLYKFIPNRKATFWSQFPGAVLSSLFWSGFSFCFSIYIDVYNGAANMYGSMTTIVLVLLWLYFCMMFVMMGAQVNHYFEEKFRWIHDTAKEAVRREYYQLTRPEVEEEDAEEEKEKRNS